MDFEEFEDMDDENKNIIGIVDADTENRISGYIRQVFTRMPKEDAEILKCKNLFFVLPSVNCSATGMYVTPLAADSTGLIPVWLIQFSDSFLAEPEHEAIYTVAHELAHVFLGHCLNKSSIEEAKENEKNADMKVIEWGFEEELRNTPDNYLYGEGMQNIFGERR